MKYKDLLRHSLTKLDGLPCYMVESSLGLEEPGEAFDLLLFFFFYSFATS